MQTDSEPSSESQVASLSSQQSSSMSPSATDRSHAGNSSPRDSVYDQSHPLTPTPHSSETSSLLSPDSSYTFSPSGSENSIHITNEENMDSSLHLQLQSPSSSPSPPPFSSSPLENSSSPSGSSPTGSSSPNSSSSPRNYDGSSGGAMGKGDVPQIDPFLLSALANPRDRLTLLKLDVELERFLKNPKVTRLEFPPMSSYQRMIVHRVAQYFKVNHSVMDIDGQRRAVVLLKTSESKIPILRFSDLREQEDSSHPQVKIMRRPDLRNQKYSNAHHYEQRNNNSNKGENENQNNTDPSLYSSFYYSTFNNNSQQEREGGQREKSLEEREEEYLRARARIFADSTPRTTSTSNSSSNNFNRPNKGPLDDQDSMNKEDYNDTSMFNARPWHTNSSPTLSPSLISPPPPSSSAASSPSLPQSSFSLISSSSSPSLVAPGPIRHHPSNYSVSSSSMKTVNPSSSPSPPPGVPSPSSSPPPPHPNDPSRSQFDQVNSYLSSLSLTPSHQNNNNNRSQNFMNNNKDKYANKQDDHLTMNPHMNNSSSLSAVSYYNKPSAATKYPFAIPNTAPLTHNPNPNNILPKSSHHPHPSQIQIRSSPMAQPRTVSHGHHNQHHPQHQHHTQHHTQHHNQHHPHPSSLTHTPHHYQPLHPQTHTHPHPHPHSHPHPHQHIPTSTHPHIPTHPYPSHNNRHQDYDPSKGQPNTLSIGTSVSPSQSQNAMAMNYHSSKNNEKKKYFNPSLESFNSPLDSNNGHNNLTSENPSNNNNPPNKNSLSSPFTFSAGSILSSNAHPQKPYTPYHRPPTDLVDPLSLLSTTRSSPTVLPYSPHPHLHPPLSPFHPFLPNSAIVDNFSNTNVLNPGSNASMNSPNLSTPNAHSPSFSDSAHWGWPPQSALSRNAFSPTPPGPPTAPLHPLVSQGPPTVPGDYSLPPTHYHPAPTHPHPHLQLHPHPHAHAHPSMTHPHIHGPHHPHHQSHPSAMSPSNPYHPHMPPLGSRAYPMSAYEYKRRPPKSTELFDPKASSDPPSSSSPNPPAPTPLSSSSTPSSNSVSTSTSLSSPSLTPLRNPTPSTPANFLASQNFLSSPASPPPDGDKSDQSYNLVSKNANNFNNPNNNRQMNHSPQNQNPGNKILMYDYSTPQPYSGYIYPLEPPQQPSHILEVCIDTGIEPSPENTNEETQTEIKKNMQSVESLLGSLKQEFGATIKKLDSETTLAIFKNSSIAKEALSQYSLSSTSSFYLRAWVAPIGPTLKEG